LSKFYYETLTKFHPVPPLNGGEEACRPFDMERNGTVAGEGCGIILLESLASALSRGRKPYCEIKGAGLGSSCATPTGWPRNEAGITRTINRALKNAGLQACDIQAVSAAANGGRELDALEAAAYAAVFGAVKEPPLLISVKGALGESFSGGGLRACALALAMEKNILPPTVGLQSPLSQQNFVIKEKREITIANALLAGISSGGTYAYLVMSNCGIQEESR